MPRRRLERFRHPGGCRCLLALALVGLPGTAAAVDVESFFLRGRYREAVTAAGDRVRLEPAQLYLLAHCHEKVGERDTARLIWRELLDGPESERGLLALAQATGRAGEGEEAARLFVRFISRFPESDRQPAAVLGLADALGRLGRAAERRDYLRRLRGYYPFSFEAAAAVAALARETGPFTVQVGSFSDLRRAEQLTRDLRQRGYDTYLTRLDGERISYRVRLGDFADEAAARAKVAALAEALGIEAIVARSP